MKFTFPLALFLLLLVPVIAWMGWPARGAARRREVISLALRLTIILCLILSLAGLEIVQRGDNLAVVFLMDVSDSMPQEAIGAEVEYVRAALRTMKPDDRAALILFGADALVERSMSPLRELSALTSVPITNQTDLAEAIQLGLALFPSGYAKRMVILSDGAQTSGDALEAGKFAAASEVQIIALPFVNRTGAEVSITGVDAPTNLRQSEQFDLNVSVQASAPTRAVVRVLAGDEMLYEQTHDLRRGAQTLSLPFTAGGAGFVNYQVQIAPEQDGYYQNNRLDAYSEVAGPPRILVVAPEPGEALPGGESRPDETSALLSALQAASFRVELIRPSHLPSDLPTLAQYDCVVLVDVPARLLGNNQMENLGSYVHDLGGGLVVIGGPTSYGVGGYYRTPLESALPVEMQIKDELRRPALGIVFVIDHSGSMSSASGGVEKLELAKEAAARSIELLFPTDRVGVIAFDDVATWVVPMTELSDPSRVISGIGSIRSGGGTDILAGLQAMANVLPDDPAKVKHVILLTDGGADITGIPELVQKLYAENGITLSTVGVGSDAAPFLKDLAAIGGGRYHFTSDASSIPSIFTEETSLATRAYLVEEPFFPTLLNSSPILSGLNEVPRLYGYVASSPKDLAQVILQSDKEDPILATWQYGLGRSVAFTSDATGRWARDWLRWEGFPVFWAQAVRYTIGSSSNTALEMNVRPEGGQMRLTLDANSPEGEFLNGYQVQANIVSPGGEAQSVTLKQIAPGRYETFFDPKEQGVYLIRFSGEAGDAQPGSSFAETIGWALSYSPEYKYLDSNPDLLLRLVTLSGGKIASSDPADVFTHDLEATRASHPVWPWLVLLAALLLPFDIASRRLIVTRQDILHLREWIRQRAGMQKAAVPQAEQSAPHLQALFKAKARAQEDTRSLQPPPSVDTNVPPPSDQPAQREEPPTEPEKAPQERTAQPPETASSTTASLLAHKKALRKKTK
ncbi:MAG: VWA domain-containing protein [Anaerolineales bacterium]|nr:VWA domain-containing protein [Anaerolineales bacterium]